MVLSSPGELIPQTSGLGLVEMGAGLIKADEGECALGGWWYAPMLRQSLTEANHKSQPRTKLLLNQLSDPHKGLVFIALLNVLGESKVPCRGMRGG